MRKLRHDEIDARRAETGRPHPISVLLENVRSIYNVGSIFRTADAAGITEIILVGITGTPENRALHKTALGAQDTVPWRYVSVVQPTLLEMKKRGYRIAALEITDTPTRPRSLQPDDFPLCLVVGNEVKGVSPDTLEVADLALELPQYGSKQSLNAAVAFGIAVYDIVSRYRELETQSREPHPAPETDHGVV